MSSNNNYYEFKDAKVAIAMELVKRGWKLYGFHEDESDWMTDYWSPAWWEGVATKDGFVVVVECPGSLRANQCFVVKSCFNHGISKGYVYQLNEHEGVNGEKYYIAYRLDKKLKKQLTGNANPANCFGYISGSYKERFLKWIETGALAWCEIQEVKTPYKVQKCVKKKIG